MTTYSSTRVGFFFFFLALALANPARLAAQEKEPKQSASGLHFVFNERPSLRIGKVFRMDFRAKIQWDSRGFSPHLNTDEGAYDLNRARFGIKGDFVKFVEYEVEREFRETFGGRVSKHEWRDVYVNSAYWDNFQIQAGKFKIPFSMEALTGAQDLQFINRSRIADNLAPARDIGVMLHGRFFMRGLSYEVGVFRNDGEKNDTGAAESEEHPGNRTYALRITGSPVRWLKLPWQLNRIELGGAVTQTDVPEGLNSLRGRTYSGTTFFDHVYMQGRRVRAGAELSWKPGPFSVQGEFIHVSEARNNQGIRLNDLPTKISRGWYLSGAWALTGEKEDGGIVPRRPFLSEGFGAVEVAARYEQIRFGSSQHIGPAFSNPRASNILGNSDRAWTIGVNWYLNHYAKIQVNGIQETIEDVRRSPIPGRSQFRTGLIRLQFSM